MKEQMKGNFGLQQTILKLFFFLLEIFYVWACRRRVSRVFHIVLKGDGVSLELMRNSDLNVKDYTKELIKIFERAIQK
ncbi:hypothetical protein [Bacillus sp. AFS023182]|uniref:hypothetical protein n=1 Tax=Bacillus sp. AFS023182 TaxID=2033492 RepID=UPI0020D22758|nr:hypothetical protein [Bacillus sp. AFS023182]